MGEIREETHSGHLERSQHTAPLASHDAAVANLRRSGVAVHLRELQLGSGSHSGRQGRVPDHVSEGLSKNSKGRQSAQILSH